ncbi:MAG: hypothetical protein ACLBM1_14830 [Cuspidothrix sp.]|jgi:hypothetical protein|uniref:hypothetical protein n=1 Tax=Cuspidothrix issatschenkoi TaxID=230752 RepID=UPI001881AB85|nr:hypothetical protein [Cuspidothrix issatschenkoi]MBE9231508.1 hypothetical protein [Cuspidothrix issatschenkoi LEGE 03284]
MKRYIPFLIIGVILFLTIGDKILPGDLGKSSVQSRTALNNFALNLFPDIKQPRNPNESTEKEVEKLEKRSQ